MFYCLLYDRNQGFRGGGGREEMGKGEGREEKRIETGEVRLIREGILGYMLLRIQLER